VKAGFGFATQRILLGYDRALSDNFELGGRIGYAFGGGPDTASGATFFPIHAEIRPSLWFGSEPFLRTGIRPYLVAALGFAQVDASVSVEVQDPRFPNGKGTLIAWKRSGKVFAGAGLGMLYAIGRNTGPFVEIRGQRLFPSSATAMTLQLGYAVGI